VKRYLYACADLTYRCLKDTFESLGFKVRFRTFFLLYFRSRRPNCEPKNPSMAGWSKVLETALLGSVGVWREPNDLDQHYSIHCVVGGVLVEGECRKG
jgi:hypothetical protein